MEGHEHGPDAQDVTRVRNTLENAGIGHQPRDATSIIGCGIEAGIRTGMTPDQLRQTCHTAIDRYQGTREPVGSSER